MGLESATYIPQLVPTNPTGQDPKSQGDDHLNLIKRVLITQLGALGLSALTVTASQINASVATGGLYSSGTTLTSMTVGTGSQTFTTQSGLGFAVGQEIKITSNANVANYMIGTCTAYNKTTGAMSVNVTQAAGSGTFADWSVTIYWGQTSSIRQRTITTGDTVAGGDMNTLLNLNGTFTLAFTAAATLGSGFVAWLQNVGTGSVTLDPNGSETIDGLTSYVMYPNEVRLLLCDGTSFKTLIVQPFSLTMTASGNFIKPPGYLNFQYMLWGGGGSGSVGNSGGGGGSCAVGILAAAQLGASTAITIGAGGAASTGATGNPGGASSIGSIVVADQGGAGAASAPARTSAWGVNQAGVGSLYSGASPAFDTPLNNTAATVYGGGGGGKAVVGGTTVHGGVGGFNGAAGTAPGGGGGAIASGTSGAGARGELRIWGV